MKNKNLTDKIAVDFFKCMVGSGLNIGRKCLKKTTLNAAFLYTKDSILNGIYIVNGEDLYNSEIGISYDFIGFNQL